MSAAALVAGMWLAQGARVRLESYESDLVIMLFEDSVGTLESNLRGPQGTPPAELRDLRNSDAKRESRNAAQFA